MSNSHVHIAILCSLFVPVLPLLHLCVSPWIRSSLQTSDECWFSFIWLAQRCDDTELVQFEVEQRSKFLYLQKRPYELHSVSSHCEVKEKFFTTELSLLCDNRRLIRMFKITGTSKRLESNKRSRTSCDDYCLGDEYHVLFEV